MSVSGVGPGGRLPGEVDPAGEAVPAAAGPAVGRGGPPLRPVIGAPAAARVFSRHLEDAIALNTARRSVYSKLSGGASEEVSDRLIASEKLDHLVTGYFDREARRFNDRGIPIVTGDFVPMSGAKPAEAPLERRGKTPALELAKLEAEVIAFHAQLLLSVVVGHFDKISERAFALSQEIDRLEAKTRSNLAMTKHVVDSIGLAALHAGRYSKMSGGETDTLAKQLIAAESVALVNAVGTDRRAQEVQALGVGIIVNDVPEIPFQAEYRAARPR
ncbi:MAG TPA: hypothetical protein VHF22_10235 [Planctomycetota bacterium]|nr:hypothetical protein [Planctomycetota bacterium]